MTVWERVGKEFGEILDSDPKIKNFYLKIKNTDPKIKNSDLKNETI